MSIECVLARRPQDTRSEGQDCCDSEGMKYLSRDIALMNVSPDGVSLILENNADGVGGFCKILNWIDAHERSGGTVFLTRVSRLLRSCWIERRVCAEVALHCEKVCGLCDC